MNAPGIRQSAASRRSRPRLSLPGIGAILVIFALTLGGLLAINVGSLLNQRR
jgi:hypothetical protein